MTTNPYSPPKSTVADPLESNRGAPQSRTPAIAVAVLFTVHIAIFIYYFGIYFELVRTGVMNPSGPLLGLISDGVMFVGVVLAMFKRYAQLPFLIASGGLLLTSVLAWSAPVSRTLLLVTYVLGAVVAFFGWWVTYRYSRNDE